MISKVSISNFKVFKDQVDFKDLKYLNFLTGINGRGKSTMLQAFIALAQSIKENGNFDLLCLNGDRPGHTHYRKNHRYKIYICLYFLDFHDQYLTPRFLNNDIKAFT